MPGPGETTYASFAATHEARLVGSLVSETGLPRAAAARVAADVLPAAYERSFATCGAAYGWLRVAARHRAAGSARWAAAADAALGHADTALTALAGLSVGDRQLLRLRYVDGLLPAALAARLGTTEADVLARLDRAHAAATGIGAPTRFRALAERVAVPMPRAAAALAAAAVAVVVGGGMTPSPAGVPPRATGPWAAAPDAALPHVTPVSGDEAVPASERAHAAVVIRTASRGPASGLPGDDGPLPPGGGACAKGCNTAYADEIHVALPKEVGDRVGRRDVVIKQEAGNKELSFCKLVAPVPQTVARCVPGRS